ncbi:MAG: dipeptide ABC transporter ATP-binding protein [Deltaproteobacteria bacterium]|nr:dipeptide ABC transporter ATP-binding protein [Deltaproteobacteria bacterium]
MTEVLLEAQSLKKHFPVTAGFILARTVSSIKAVDGVSFIIRQGETLSLVGESGCGKTTTAKMILLLEDPTMGSILFRGKDLQRLTPAEMKEYRASVQAVFQDPWSSLNPRLRVGSIIGEPLVVNRALPSKAIQEQVRELLLQVGLRPDHDDLYPHEFSGGQRQRIAIARALSLKPALIVLDEPVSALDVSIRAQIMNLLKDLQHQYGLGYLLIAHNLATVRYMSHRVAVMYLGKIVETAQTKQLFSHPQHPYTRALISAALRSRPDTQDEEIVLPGEVPSPLDPPPGCSFHPRCSNALPLCSKTTPVPREQERGHWVACHLAETLTVATRATISAEERP